METKHRAAFTHHEMLEITRRANAYPKLVGALREIEQTLMVPSTPSGNATPAEHNMLSLAHTLLRELGESA